MNRLATRESKNSPKPTWNALVYYHEVRDPTVVIQGLQGSKKWPAFHVLCSNTVNLNLVLVSTKTPFWCLSPLAALTKSRSIHELFPDKLHLNGICHPSPNSRRGGGGLLVSLFIGGHSFPFQLIQLHLGIITNGCPLYQGNFCWEETLPGAFAPWQLPGSLEHTTTPSWEVCDGWSIKPLLI